MNALASRAALERIARSRDASASASELRSPVASLRRVVASSRRSRRFVSARAPSLAESLAIWMGHARGSLVPAPRAALDDAGAAETETKSADEAASARLLLLCVPALWATYAPALRYVFTSDVPPGSATLSLVRIGLMQLPFLPALYATARRSTSSDVEERTRANRSVRAAIELGAYNSIATALQAWGLEHTSSTHSGFIMGSVNVLVPTLAVLQGDVVHRDTWLAAAFTLVGVCVLGLDSVSASSEIIFDGALRGDVAVFCSAACYAAMTLRASTYGKEFTAAELMGTKTLVMLVFMSCWYARTFSTAGGAVDEASFGFMASPVVALAVVYSAFVPGALASYIQLKGQGGVPASEAQLIYAATPVFNAGVSALVLEEALTPNAALGGAVVLAASLSAFARGDASDSTPTPTPAAREVESSE